jgi:hypothetical protein
MTEPLPKWIQTRYAELWKKFGEKEFTFEQATKVLDKKGINVFFSDLRKAGWISVQLSEKDTRKRVYRLKKPEEAIKELNN